MGVELLVASEIVSAGLASVLIHFFLKAYRLTGSIYLLGLPFGFSFLASSYVFLGLSLAYGNSVAVSEVFLWMRLIVQCYGFAFIAFAYYFPSRPERSTKRALGMISLASLVSILLFFATLLAMPPFLQFPSANIVDECFTVVNLGFLLYIIYRFINYWESPHKAVSGLIWTPSAFSLFVLSQYSWLIWGIDGSQTAFVLAHINRIAALLLFIRIYYVSGRVNGEIRETH